MAKKIGKLARRYAKALLAAVKESNSSNIGSKEVAEVLADFAKVWENDPQLAGSLLNPMFNKDERKKALQEIVKSASMGEDVLRFATVLLERDRLSILPEIALAFVELADEAEGIVRVELTTALSVSDDEKSEVERRLNEKISGTPVYTWRTDESLIGGMTISYRGKIVDGSVEGKLQRLERCLAA